MFDVPLISTHVYIKLFSLKNKSLELSIVRADDVISEKRGTEKLVYETFLATCRCQMKNQTFSKIKESTIRGNVGSVKTTIKKLTDFGKVIKV